MRAFVAGATGYTGREVVRVLREHGADTVAHVRPDSARLDEWRARFEGLGAAADSTPWEPAAVRATFERVKPDVVFALLGTTRAREREAASAGRSDASYDAVDYGMTAMLLDAARGIEPKPRFVYLSAIGAKAGASSPYLAVRGRLEAELRASGVPFTIARPSWISGADREGRTGERIGATVTDALAGVASLLGARSFRDRYRSMTGAQLADGLVRVAMDPAYEGRVVEADELR